MARKIKSIDADSASEPKISRVVLSINEKMKIMDMIEIERHCIVCLDCQVVWQVRFFHSIIDEEQRKNSC
jgi:hypothetical protein